MAEHQLTCAGCGVQSTSTQPKAKYCGAACRDEASRQRKRRERKPPSRIEAVTYECWWCGSHYHPKRLDRSKACSRECGFKVRDFIRSIKANGGRVTHRAKRRHCDHCGKPFTQRNNRVTCSIHCANDRAERLRVQASQLSDEATCQECHRLYAPVSSGGRPSLYCSDECRGAVTQRRNRISRLLRKRRLRSGMHKDRIDPIKVFERDAWRCGICGLNTDKTKRGTWHPKAPELDHIVALANGGTHTWDNVQCSHRSCNGSKGATNYGQLSLFPVP